MTDSLSGLGGRIGIAITPEIPWALWAAATQQITAYVNAQIAAATGSGALTAGGLARGAIGGGAAGALMAPRAIRSGYSADLEGQRAARQANPFVNVATLGTGQPVLQHFDTDLDEFPVYGPGGYTTFVRTGRPLQKRFGTVTGWMQRGPHKHPIVIPQLPAGHPSGRGGQFFSADIDGPVVSDPGGGRVYARGSHGGFVAMPPMGYVGRYSPLELERPTGGRQGYADHMAAYGRPRYRGDAVWHPGIDMPGGYVPGSGGQELDLYRGHGSIVPVGTVIPTRARRIPTFADEPGVRVNRDPNSGLYGSGAAGFSQRVDDPDGGRQRRSIWGTRFANFIAGDPEQVGWGMHIPHWMRHAGTAVLGSATFMPPLLRNVALGTGFSLLFGGAAGAMGLGAGAAVGGTAYSLYRQARGGTQAGMQIPGDLRAAGTLDDLIEQFHTLANALSGVLTPAAEALATVFGSATSTIADFVGWLERNQGAGRGAATSVLGESAGGAVSQAGRLAVTGAGLWAGIKGGATVGAAVGGGGGALLGGVGAAPGAAVGGLLGGVFGGITGLGAGEWLFGKGGEQPSQLGRYLQGGGTYQQQFRRYHVGLSSSAQDVFRNNVGVLRDRDYDLFKRIMSGGTLLGSLRGEGGFAFQEWLEATNKGAHYSWEDQEFLYRQFMAAALDIDGYMFGEARARTSHQGFQRAIYQPPGLTRQQRMERSLETAAGYTGMFPAGVDLVNVSNTYRTQQATIGRQYRMQRGLEAASGYTGIFPGGLDMVDINNTYRTQTVLGARNNVSALLDVEKQRIQINRDLIRVMQEETQLRYQRIQHAAAERLDSMNERRGLNLAIHGLSDFTGVKARPYGGLLTNVAAHDQWTSVLGHIAQLEDSTLAAISGRARQEGLSSAEYIAKFITKSTGFELPENGLSDIMQQLGSANAKESAEDLSLAMQANALRQRGNDLRDRNNELMEENNRLVEALQLVMWSILSNEIPNELMYKFIPGGP